MKNSKTSCHRSDSLDKLLGVPVTILFADDDVIDGTLEYEEARGTYRLDRPWASDVIFHKSIVRRIRRGYIDETHLQVHTRS